MWHFHPPSTAFRGPIGSSNEAPSGTVKLPPSTAFRGPMGSSTEAPGGTVRKRPGNSIWRTTHP
eukprot:2453128-Pyramimonas_sp.AAC.1